MFKLVMRCNATSGAGVVTHLSQDSLQSPAARGTGPVAVGCAGQIMINVQTKRTVLLPLVSLVHGCCEIVHLINDYVLR